MHPLPIIGTQHKEVPTWYRCGQQHTKRNRDNPCTNQISCPDCMGKHLAHDPNAPTIITYINVEDHVKQTAQNHKQ